MNGDQNICGVSNLYSYKSLSQCENKCNEMDNCLGFNFYDESSVCYLKQLLNERCPIKYHSTVTVYLKFELGKISIHSICVRAYNNQNH